VPLTYVFGYKHSSKTFRKTLRSVINKIQLEKL